MKIVAPFSKPLLLILISCSASSAVLASTIPAPAKITAAPEITIPAPNNNPAASSSALPHRKKTIAAAASTMPHPEKPNHTQPPLITPLNPTTLTKSILEAPAQIKFSSKAWKDYPDSRQRMLVDFYLQQQLLHKTPDEIHALLGEPFHIEKSHTVSQYYQLGQYSGKEIFLEVVFFNNQLSGLSIGQKLPPGNQYIFAGDWHWQNPDNAMIAEELNQHFYLVGAPVQHLCQLFGQPTKDGAHWSCGNFEFDYSADESKVSRFRVLADKSFGITDNTNWQDKDLRVNKGSYSTAFDLYSLSEPEEAWLTKPGIKFNSEVWLANACRRYLLFDLTHNYNLVGSTRARIRKLLGAPTFDETTLDEGDRKQYFLGRLSEPAPMNKFDWYRLDHPGCTSDGPVNNFELVYKNDMVAAYRVIQANFYKDHAAFYPGPECNERQGGPMPPLH